MSKGFIQLSFAGGSTVTVAIDDISAIHETGDRTARVVMKTEQFANKVHQLPVEHSAKSIVQLIQAHGVNISEA